VLFSPFQFVPANLYSVLNNRHWALLLWLAVLSI
jgi:hypothetical protein